MSRLNEEGDKVPKMGTIAWHQYHIDRLTALRREVGKKSAAVKPDKLGNKKSDYAEGYGNTQVGDRKKVPNRYRSRVEYDFLKYIRVAYKWALENHPTLTRSQIDLLLYLHCLGAFSRTQFDDYHRLVGIYSVKTLTKFIDEGYIKVWKTADKKSHMLYAFTQKSKYLCNKMHRYCCGVEDISLNPINNNMTRKDAPRINNYYIEMIKRMAKDKADLNNNREQENPDD